MAFTAGFSVNVGDPTKASDVDVLAANDDYLKNAIDTFIANDANNRVLTGTGSGTANAETNLTFDGSTLTVTGTVSATTFSGNVTGGTISGTTGTYSGNVTISKDAPQLIMTDSGSGGGTSDIIIDAIGSNHGFYFRADGASNHVILESNGDFKVDADTLFVDASADRVGINTSVPTEELDIEGSGATQTIRLIRTDASTAGGITINSANGSNYVYNTAAKDLVLSADNGATQTKLHSNGDFSVNTSQLFVDQSASRVGINNNSPATPLHVKDASTAYVMTETTGTSTSAGFRLKGDASADYTIFTTQGVGNFGIYDNANTAQRLTIDTSGNMGLGTDSPDGLLHLKDGDGTEPSFASDDYLIIQNNNDASDSARMTIISGTSGYGRIGFGDSGGRDRGRIAYNHADDSLGFGTNGSAATNLVLDASGNLSLSAGFVTVAGNPSASAIGSNGNGQIGGLTGNGLYMYGKGSTYDLALANANTTVALAIPTGGSATPDVYIPNSLGIGTVSPTCRLDLAGTGGGSPTGAVPAGGVFVKVTDTATVGEGAVLRLQSTNGAKETAATIAAVHSAGNNGDLTFGMYEGGATHNEKMRITSAGNVGIGTNLPADSASFSRALDVNGTSGAAVYVRTNGSASNYGYIGHYGTTAYFVNASAGPMAFYTNGSEFLRITSAGNVGIGSQSPTYKLVVSNGGAAGYEFNVNGLNSGVNTLTYNRSTSAYVDSAHFVNNYYIYSGQTPAERFRVESTGVCAFMTSNVNVRFNGTASSTVLTDNNGVEIYTGGYIWAARQDNSLYLSRAGSTGEIAAFRYNAVTQVGSISVTSTATAYNTSSDYRLKENLVPITGAVDRVNALQPRRFNFISDPDTTVDGFVAHEVSPIVPESVNGEKDAVDEDGNPVYQGIDQSKLVPLLTAAIQELTARIEALEAA